MKAVARGIYIDKDGKFWARGKFGGKMTRRRLYGRTLSEVQQEITMRDLSTVLSFDALATTWIERGCPRVEYRVRGEAYAARAKKYLAMPRVKWGDRRADTISKLDRNDYPRWRMELTRKGSGEATVDLELSYCRSLYAWALENELVKTNPFTGMERIQDPKTVVHCTAKAPLSADDVHRIGKYLLEKDVRTESFGWLFLWLAHTGARVGEMAGLPYQPQRVDGRRPLGDCDGKSLVLMRYKTGSEQEVPLQLEGSRLWRAFTHWHDSRYPQSAFWFPSPFGESTRHVVPNALNAALNKACDALGLKRVTPHGCRSFFAGVVRNRLDDDRLAADFMGHANPDILRKVYGGRMTEREGLALDPVEVPLAYAAWMPAENVVKLA